MTAAGAAPDRRAGNWAVRGWQAVRGVSSRISLRTKLLATLLTLVIIALAAMGLAGTTIVRNNQLGTVDTELAGSQDDANAAVKQYLRDGQPTYEPDFAVYWLSSTGQLSAVVLPANNNGNFSYQTQLYAPSLSGVSSRIAAHPGQPTTVAASQGGGRWRVAGFAEQFTVTNLVSGNSTTINGTAIVAIDVTNVYSTVRELAGADLIVSVIILFVIAVVGFALVQANLRPLVGIEETAGEIAEGHLNRRVPERDPRTEIGSLGRSLNTMLSQIESAFHEREKSEAAAHQSEERMRRFIADASHELRTPLTAIRGFAEYYRQRGGLVQQWDEDETPTASDSGLTADDLDRIMHRVEAEAARMGLLVEDLLLLARMDQQRPLNRNPVDLLSLAADAVHDTRMLAPSRTIDLKVQPGAAFLVIGDEPRLRQVIGNLMSNALTHTPDGTPIEVSIESGVLDPRASGTQPAVILDVKDHGPGMPPEQAQRVFERFYRADQARTRATGGSGLGLAIVAALVAAHGGLASVRTAPGQGATFRIAFPLAPEAQGHPEGADADDDLPADAAAEAR